MSHGVRGRFITFEGIDGAGKSSHLQVAVDWLRTRGHTVVLTREPGGTELAEAVRELVLNRAMDALTEALLVFAARRDHVVRCIQPALQAGQVVVCDRFTDASFAYQGGGRGLDLVALATLERWVHGGLQPDLTLWFDLPPADAAARRAAARTPDRFEEQDLAFFQRVHDGYAQRFRDGGPRWHRIDATGVRSSVEARVVAALSRVFGT